MKENDGCPLIDHEEIITQDGRSPQVPKPNDLLVQSQGPIKSMHPQKLDKLSGKELVCQKYINDAVFDYNQEHHSRQLHHPAIQSPANRKQSDAQEPKHQSLSSDRRSDIASLNDPGNLETIYDYTENVSTHAKSNPPTLADHTQLDSNRTDLYPQTLLNCDSVEFEAMLNHLYSL